jgi:hypothetical protein
VIKKEFCLLPMQPTMRTVQRQKSFKETVEELLRMKMVAPIATEYDSQVEIVRKKDGSDGIRVN